MKLFLKSLVFATCVFGSCLAHDGQAANKSAYQFLGKHFVASYKDCDTAALTNIPKLREALLKAAKASGATILKSQDYTFEPDGFTMAILLSESHASIHTYPEYKACFIDLFTCGNKCSAKAFDKALREYLKPGKVESDVFTRK